MYSFSHLSFPIHGHTTVKKFFKILFLCLIKCIQQYRSGSYFGKTEHVKPPKQKLTNVHVQFGHVNATTCVATIVAVISWTQLVHQHTGVVFETGFTRTLKCHLWCHGNELSLSHTDHRRRFGGKDEEDDFIPWKTI